MKESFEKKPRSLETEAGSYDIKTDFSVQKLLAQARSYSGRAYVDFAISKEKRTLYLSMDGHAKIIREHYHDELESGGKVFLNNGNPEKKFLIEEMDGITGSSLANTSAKDLQLIRGIVQKYLDKINK